MAVINFKNQDTFESITGYDIDSFQRKLSVTRYSNAKNTKPAEQLYLTWSELTNRLSHRDIRPNKDGLAFSGVKLIDGTTRKSANVEYQDLLIADIDSKGIKDQSSGRIIKVTELAPDIEKIQHRINDYEFFCYSSHGYEADVIKYRIVFHYRDP